MTGPRRLGHTVATVAVCVSVLIGFLAPATAWSTRRSPTRATPRAPVPLPVPSTPLAPLVAFSEPLASGVRPLLATPFQNGTWTSPAATAAAGPFTSSGGALHWKVARTRPDRKRQVVVFQENDPFGRDALHAAFWDGTSWDDGSGAPLGDAKAFDRIGTTGSADTRGFDAAFEQKSGELLVVAGVNTDETVKYWVHGGTSWNSTTLLQSVANNTQDNVNVFDWVRLAPMPGTNRIAFLGAANDPIKKDSAAIEAMIWDGDTNTWGGKYILSFPVSNAQRYHSTDAIDVRFTLGGTNAGEAVAVWGNGPKVYSSTWRPGATWTAPKVVADMGTGVVVRWLRLAADPMGDDMVLAVGDADGTTGRLTTVPYDGATRTWGSVSSFHAVSTFGDPLRNRPFDIAWDPIVAARNVLLVYANPAGLWSTRSSDGGVLFGSPEAVGEGDPAWWVQLERQPDGIVHLAAHDSSDDLRGFAWNGYYWLPTTTTTVTSGLEAGTSHGVEAFALASVVAAGRPSPPASDLNGDGRADLLWQNQASRALSVWFLEGSVLTGSSVLRPESFADPQWQVRGLGDFNRDGSLDVLWHHQGTREVFAWLLDRAVAVGGSYLSPPTAPNLAWEIQGAADFDGDGGPDILWNDPVTREIHVWLMDGLRVRQSRKLSLTSYADTSWQICGLADLDADGRTDVLWHNQSTGVLYAWMMNGLALASSGYLTPYTSGSPQWSLALVADFNGDRRPDLLWHHPKTGELYVWYMEGLGAVSGGYLSPSRFGDAAWSIVPR